MNGVRRVYVEKKPAAMLSRQKALASGDSSSYLGINAQ